MVTPFDSDGKVDEALHRDDVRFMLGANVHGLAVCGSTGEGHTVSTEETRTITAATIEEVGGRIPVVTGMRPRTNQQRNSRASAARDGLASAESSRSPVSPY